MISCKNAALTVIVLVAYPVVRGAGGVALKFGLTATVSFSVTLVLVEVLGRWPPIGVAFGLRRR